MRIALNNLDFLSGRKFIYLVVSLFVFCAGSAFGGSATANTAQRENSGVVAVGNPQEFSPVSTDEFQMSMIGFLYRMQDDAAGTNLALQAGQLADQILGLNSEQLETWLAAIPNSRKFVSLLNVQSPRNGGTPDPNSVTTEASESAIRLQHLGPLSELGNAPDYPPDSGHYGEWLIEQLQDLLLLPSVNPETQRCEINGWARFFEMWDKAKAASDDLELLCVSTNGDPIGLINGPACGLYSIALGATSLLEVPLRECDAHIGNVDSAEIQATYRNTNRLIRNSAHIHHDIEQVDGSLESMETDIEEVLQESLAIRTDIATHDANIDGDLASHDTNIETAISSHGQNMVYRLTSHDERLINHDAHIDADLASHHADNKARLIWMQHTLDEKVELKRVRIEVAEIKNRDSYLVMTEESGKPVNVSFESIETFDEKLGGFHALEESVVERIEPGVYVVKLQPQAQSNGKIFRFKVRHYGIEHHYGQIVFHAEMRSASN